MSIQISMRRLLTITCAVAALGTTSVSFAADVASPTSWSDYGGGKYFQRYSPLAQIGAGDLGKAQTAWSRSGVDASIKGKFPDLSPSTNLRGTPIAVDGVLYAQDAVGLVEAFDGATGATRWVQGPLPETLKEAAGQGLRGVSYWRAAADERVISIRGEYLYALNAKTGQPIAEFGDGGRVYVGWPSNEPYTYRATNGPIVANDVIVITGTGGSLDGGGSGDAGTTKEGLPENIRGYDVRTGHLLWTFHVLEDKHTTWGKDSYRFVGNMGAFGSVSADEALNLVYVPLTAPTMSYFGGHRPGDNLYSSSLVALNSKTGKLVWAQQLVHHDMWDYDAASPPILGDVRVGGKLVKTVMQANKVGFLYVFDRATGKPVWPIEERPVPQSTVPGEASSPTQPFPTKLPGFDLQGVTEADLADFTPAIKAEAQQIANRYVLGPVFTPPTLVDPSEGGKKGTLAAPGVWGSGNWNTGAFDPEVGAYYAVSRTEPTVYGLFKPTGPKASIDYAVADINPPPLRADDPAANGPRAGLPKPPLLSSGLPLLKPPYGRVTVYDIGKGEQLWMAPNGDDPAIRSNPALTGVQLPKLLGNAGRGAPLLTKSALFLPDSSDAISGRAGIHSGAKLRGYDKRTGEVMSELALPAGATGAPMTYLAGGRQFIVLPVGGADYGSGWVAFTVPGK